MNSIVWFILYIHHPPTNMLEVFFVPTDPIQEFLHSVSISLTRIYYKTKLSKIQILNLEICVCCKRFDCMAQWSDNIWQLCDCTCDCVQTVIMPHVSNRRPTNHF